MPLNLYRPPPPLLEQPYHLNTPEAEYDVNFCFPAPARLSTPGGVVLVPLIPSLHAIALYDRFKPHPVLYRYLPYGPFPSLASFLTHLELSRQNPQILTFAIFDQSLVLPPLPPSSPNEQVVDDATRPERLAGQLSYTKADPSNRTVELGAVFLAPEFQRSHVLTHAAFLALRHAFEREMRLRRVQWYAHQMNARSPVAARRLGFVDEGVVRWEWVIPVGKEGLTGEEGVEGKGGRHVFVLGMGWDDWRDGARERLEGLVGREVRPRVLAG